MDNRNSRAFGGPVPPGVVVLGQGLEISSSHQNLAFAMQKTEDGGAEEMRKGPYHRDIVRESMDPEWRVLARQASIE